MTKLQTWRQPRKGNMRDPCVDANILVVLLYCSFVRCCYWKKHIKMLLLEKTRDLFVLLLTTAFQHYNIHFLQQHYTITTLQSLPYTTTVISKLNNKKKTKLPNNSSYRKISDPSSITDSESNYFIRKHEPKGSQDQQKRGNNI